MLKKEKINSEKDNIFIKEYNFCLLKIPTETSFLSLLNTFHKNTNHGGYKLMIDKFNSEKIYVKGITQYIYNTINDCTTCYQANNNNQKREKSSNIILDYPKKRYIADITYLRDIFEDNLEYPYLLVIQEHSSKFCMAYLIYDKEREILFCKIKKL